MALLFFCHCKNRLYNLYIAGATAEVSGNGLFHLSPCWAELCIKKDPGPQVPKSQPLFVPVSPRSSLNTSRRVLFTSVRISFSSLLTFNFKIRFIVITFLEKSKCQSSNVKSMTNV